MRLVLFCSTLLLCHIRYGGSSDPAPDILGFGEDSALSAEVVVPSPREIVRIGLFDDPCDTPGTTCSLDRNLRCDPTTKTCQCQHDLVEHLPTVYSATTGHCHEIPSKRTSWACQVTEQCQESSFGQHSFCEEGRCECLTKVKGQAVVKFDSVCYLFKTLGDSCRSHKECDVSIDGDANCGGIGRSLPEFGICSCAEGFEAFNSSANACLPLGSFNSKCELDGQCGHWKALGPLARCNDQSRRCECYDTEEAGSRATGYHRGKCHLSRSKGEECTADQECQTGYHEDAVCASHESYNGNRVCACPGLKWCGENGGSVIDASTAAVTAGLSIISFCLFLKSMG